MEENIRVFTDEEQHEFEKDYEIVESYHRYNCEDKKKFEEKAGEIFLGLGKADHRWFFDGRKGIMKFRWTIYLDEDMNGGYMFSHKVRKDSPEGTPWKLNGYCRFVKKQK